MREPAVGVHVALDGEDVEVGTLYCHRRGRAESATFVYDVGYVTRRGAYELEPALPLGTAPVQTAVGRSMFGAFGDSAPDRWGRTLIRRAEARAAREAGRPARSLSEVDYLLGVRDDLRQGSLRFRIGDGPYLARDDVGVPALTDLPELTPTPFHLERSVRRPQGARGADLAVRRDVGGAGARRRCVAAGAGRRRVGAGRAQPLVTPGSRGRARA